jgi:hypothetical protein
VGWATASADGEVGDLDPEVAEQPRVRDGRGRDRQVLQRDDRAGGQPDARERVVGGEDLDDLAVGEPHAPRLEPFAVLVADRGSGVREDGDVVAQLAEHQRLVRGQRCRGEDADPGAARLVAVAVRAVQDVAAPTSREAGDRGQLVGQPGRHDDAAGLDLLPVGQIRAEPRPQRFLAEPLEPGHLAGPDLTPVRDEGRPAVGQQLGGGGALAAEVVVHARRGRVARLARVDDEDGAQRAGQGHAGGETGRATSHHEDVEERGGRRFCGHAPMVVCWSRLDKWSCRNGK